MYVEYSRSVLCPPCLWLLFGCSLAGDLCACIIVNCSGTAVWLICDLEKCLALNTQSARGNRSTDADNHLQDPRRQYEQLFRSPFAYLWYVQTTEEWKWSQEDVDQEHLLLAFSNLGAGTPLIGVEVRTSDSDVDSCSYFGHSDIIAFCDTRTPRMMADSEQFKKQLFLNNNSFHVWASFFWTWKFLKNIVLSGIMGKCHNREITIKKSIQTCSESSLLSCCDGSYSDSDWDSWLQLSSGISSA